MGYLSFFAGLVFCGLTLPGTVSATPVFPAKPDTLTWYDATRGRTVPVAFYAPKNTIHAPVVIFSHGYGANQGGDYLIYSYLTEKLAAEGFFVLSIQHELPTDSLIPLTGHIQTVRRPFWDRGADNIRFALEKLKTQNPELDYTRVTLIGHSNGGDMTALFPQKYPGIVAKIICLDNRRMLLPRGTSPKVYSLRSSDLPADEGVLPTEDERKRFGMTVIVLPNTKHDQMDNDATSAQRKEIIRYILTFLNE